MKSLMLSKVGRNRKTNAVDSVETPTTTSLKSMVGNKLSKSQHAIIIQ